MNLTVIDFLWKKQRLIEYLNAVMKSQKVASFLYMASAAYFLIGVALLK